jgi:hypothetical protein
VDEMDFLACDSAAKAVGAILLIVNIPPPVGLTTLVLDEQAKSPKVKTSGLFWIDRVDSTEILVRSGLRI